MIDINEEAVITLSEAARILPHPNGKAPHVSTIWRWCRRGCHGIQLEFVRIGHRVCTSKEALNRFANKLGEVDVPAHGGHPHAKPRTPSRRAAEIEAAEAELSSAGL